MFEGPKDPYTYTRTSTGLKIPYYLKPADVEDYGKSKWRKLDEAAETRYIHNLNIRCQYENAEQQRHRQEAEGWGIFPDQIRIQRANQMVKPSCKRLTELGIPYY